MNKYPIILGGQQGQFGDCIISTVVARAIKEKFPNSYYIYGINKKYWEISPLFEKHPFIDKVIEWYGYDNFPTENDINIFNNIKPDIFLHPMASHPNNDFWPLLVNKQEEAACIMQGLVPPKDLTCYLNKWFKIRQDLKKKFICISPFTQWNHKNISNEKWQSIIDYISSKDLQVIQIGTPTEYKFKNTYKENVSFFESVKLLLACRFTICLDGCMNWLCGAYQHPVLGLLGYSYSNLNSSKLYQPINPNSIYLEASRAEQIPNELIFQKIDEMLEKYEN